MPVRIDEVTAEVPEEGAAGRNRPAQAPQQSPVPQGRSPQQEEGSLAYLLRRLELRAQRLRAD